MGKTPAANAVLNPKARYARKNQQPVIPSEGESRADRESARQTGGPKAARVGGERIKSLDETLRHTVCSKQ